MKKYNKITPEGTRDLLFEECEARRTVEKTLADVFSSRGFHEVVTPGLEFYDVFDPEHSGIAQEDMYKMSDQRTACGDASRRDHADCAPDRHAAQAPAQPCAAVL